MPHGGSLPNRARILWLSPRVRNVFGRIDQHLDDRRTLVRARELHAFLQLVDRAYAARPRAERSRRGREVNRPVPDAAIGVAAPPLRDLDEAQRAVVEADPHEG